MQLLDMAAQGAIELVISEPIMAETLRVLRNKFQWSSQALQEAEATLSSITTHVSPKQPLYVIQHDEPDNRILECAQEAKSDYIISADNDLLRLQQFGKARIVKVADFLRVVGQAAPGRER